MQNPQSLTLYTNFQTALNQHQKLSREMVFAVAKQVIDQHFATQPVMQQPMMMMTAGPAGVVTGPAVVAAGTTAPVQWSRLLNTKEYGLPAFFTAETATLKAATPGLNHFTLVKNLRDQFEKTSRWNDYVQWVKARHPLGPSLKDPSPRKSETEKAPAVTAGVVVPGATPGVVPVPGVVVVPVPGSVVAPVAPVVDQVAPVTQLQVAGGGAVATATVPESTGDEEAVEDEVDGPSDV